MVIFRSNFKSFRQTTLGYEFVPMVKSWVRIRTDHMSPVRIRTDRGVLGANLY